MCIRDSVQTEGGIGQGIGMALYENVTYNADGKIAENDFMQYKICLLYTSRCV